VIILQNVGTSEIVEVIGSLIPIIVALFRIMSSDSWGCELSHEIPLIKRQFFKITHCVKPEFLHVTNTPSVKMGPQNIAYLYHHHLHHHVHEGLGVFPVP
jgi:hypothetical protein